MYVLCFTGLVKWLVTTVAQVLFHLNSLHTLLYTVCGKTDVTGSSSLLNYARAKNCCPCFLLVIVFPGMGRPVAGQG